MKLRRHTTTTLLSLLVFTMMLAWVPAAAVAAPLGLQPGFPQVSTAGFGTASYDAGSGALTVTVTPHDVILPPATLELITAPKSWTIKTGFSVLEGGIPIAHDGKIIGSIGVSGVLSNQDAQTAQAGIDALK